MEQKAEGSSAGGVAGFQIPLAIKQRKPKIDELIKQVPDINEMHVLLFLSSLDDQSCTPVAQQLDDSDYNSLADSIRDHTVRSVVGNKVREVVRKKAGGGGYVLYSPNNGKKRPPKAVGNFPTKLGAKSAELARFPPKDPKKLTRLRKSVDKLRKDPKKGANAEKRAQKEKGSHVKEDLTLLRGAIRRMIQEALFHEERTGSEWDEHISRLSKGALSGDKKFQSFQKNIETQTSSVLKDALKAIQKATKSVAKIKAGDVKKNAEKGKTYMSFSAEIGEVEVNPIHIYIDNGTPHIEISDQAKAAMTKADPEELKKFRAELVMTQERVLDKMEGLISAIGKRDSYLDKLEDSVDRVIAGMSPLEISLLKALLVKKYRKST